VFAQHRCEWFSAMPGSDEAGGCSVAERVTGQSWEQLVQQRVSDPLQMRNSTCSPPESGEITRAYHETSARQLVRSRFLGCSVVAPEGGAIYSRQGGDTGAAATFRGTTGRR
jgi:CubicO group peptidase (beta-lactamase class C family)